MFLQPYRCERTKRLSFAANVGILLLFGIHSRGFVTVLGKGVEITPVKSFYTERSTLLRWKDESYLKLKVIESDICA